MKTYKKHVREIPEGADPIDMLTSELKQMNSRAFRDIELSALMTCKMNNVPTATTLYIMAELNVAVAFNGAIQLGRAIGALRAQMETLEDPEEKAQGLLECHAMTQYFEKNVMKWFHQGLEEGQQRHHELEDLEKTNPEAAETLNEFVKGLQEAVLGKKE